MSSVTHDRAEIIHFIGRQHGSPALKADGAPTFVTGHESGDARRVGWAPFFKAVEERKLAMRFAEDGTWSWVDRKHAHEHPTPGEVSTNVPPEQPQH